MTIEFGLTRIVFVFKNIVAKIPNFRNGYEFFLLGILANFKEKNFNKINRHDLAKVRYCNNSGLFLVMQKANKIQDMSEEVLLKVLQERYELDEYRSFMLSDFKINNWGYINGEIVKIDYG